IYRTLRKKYKVFLSLNGQSALEILKDEDIVVILADQRMPEMNGVEFFRKAMEIKPEVVRILITGYSDIEATIKAINEAKIFYYIHKPWEPEELQIIVERAVEQYRLKQENEWLIQELQKANEQLRTENILLHQEVERQYRFDNIIGTSPAMEQVFTLMRKVIPTDTTVLLIGETGTGKELVARAIHYNGPRKDKLFVAQNCGALPDTLLESELFGHVKGAFTGATSDKKGLFEIANGGTIFLDEIADTSPAMQQRLLRVLQEGEIHPLGSEKTIHVDVRIISATNRSLEDAIREGKFREDLYYRLSVFPIHLPPLRERREDIPLLVDFFLHKYMHKMGKQNIRISPDALSTLMAAELPGNVRQLENLIERAVTLCDDNTTITPEHLEIKPPISLSTSHKIFTTGNHTNRSLRDIITSMEKFYIAQALEETGGNITKVAKMLGLSRLGLHKKLQRYQINPADYKQS
ncbi:MAG: sigma-54-dependent Fis family transcriptional regulator, partial [Calditrichaeota bacterium]